MAGLRDPCGIVRCIQTIYFSDFLWGRDSSEVLPNGGAENTKAVGVHTGADVFSTISGGTGCTGPYFLFLGN